MKKLFLFVFIFVLICGAASADVWAEEAGWEVESTFEALHDGGSITAVGENIYHISGVSRLVGAPRREVDIYNTKSKEWRKGTPIPISVSSPASVVVDKKIYVFAGSGAKGKLQMYDTETDIWLTGEKPLSIPTGVAESGSTASLVNDKIYIISGHSSDQVDIFDIRTGAWTSGKAIPVAVNGAVSGIIGNKIYIAGGLVQPDNIASTNILQIYNTETNTWTTGSPMKTARNGAASIQAGDRVYVIGGVNNNSAEQVHILNTEIYDAITNTWTEGTSLFIGRYSAGAVLVNGKIYLTAGNTGLVESLRILSEETLTARRLSVLLSVSESLQLSLSEDLLVNNGYHWTSLDESAVLVDVYGRITAVGEGEAEVLVENAEGTFHESMPIKVVLGNADALRLAVHLNMGESVRLYLNDDPGRTVFTSMDESVAAISAEGQVTAVGEGLALIQAELDGEIFMIYVRVK